MRRLPLVIGAIIGLIVVLLAYAYFNLSEIIQAKRGYILARISNAIGRPVEVDEIKAHLGWGLAIDLSEVKITDDPAFEQIPFLQAHDVYVKVSLLPLLVKSLEITQVVISEPAVRLIRNHAGSFNVSSIGSHRAPKAEAPPPPATAGSKTSAGKPEQQLQFPSSRGESAKLSDVRVGSFTIENGTLHYADEQAGGPPINLTQFDLTVSDFRDDSSFRIEAALAAMSDQPNLKIDGRIGPLVHDGALTPDLVPLDLTATVGPLSLAQLRALPRLGQSLPVDLAISIPITIDAKISGEVGALHLAAHSDLSSAHLVYGSLIDKGAGVPCQLNVNGARNAGRIALEKVGMAVDGLSLTAADITYGEGKVAARLDSNQSDLAKLAEVLTIARLYQLSGQATLHANVALAERKPSVTGSLVLSQVNFTPPEDKGPPVTKLSGAIQMAGDTAKVGPLSGNVASSHATLRADVRSFEPLRAAYHVVVDTLRLGEFVPSRRDQNDDMVQVAANGNASADGDRLSASTKLTSSSGALANVAYQNLSVSAAYDDHRVTIDSLNAGAFGGALSAAGSATLGTAPSFDLNLSVRNIDLQQALESQKAKAAETIRGFLTGDLRVTGAGAKFDRIRPTLRGTGRATLNQGKLVGVNVVAQALKKIDKLPGIGALVPASVVGNHPELFKSNDTAIYQASLSFTLLGPRVTSHDINAQTADYQILGDGWFDMDKQLDLTARILLSRAFSSEMVSARHNVVYLETPQRQVEIPLQIVGQLPKPLVIPNVAVLVERATSNALERGLGKLLGGSFNKARNPFDQLKGLFH